MVTQIKKILLSAAVAILFVLYAFQERPQSIAVDPKTLAALQAPPPVVRSSSPTPFPTSTPAVVPPSITARSDTRSLPVTTQAAATDPPATATATSTPQPPTVTPTVAQNGAFLDGVYTGSEEDAHWGNVAVVATVTNGALTDVQFLEYPNHRNRSVEINNYAVPELIQEAIQAQSAEVDVVSGATDTSRAFIQSLQTALQQAQP